MAYTKNDLLDLGVQDLTDARRRIVGIEIFDYIDDFKPNKQVSELISYTLEQYLEFLQILSGFSKTNMEKILNP